MTLATFGGGCFWCTEALFQRLNGVEKVVSGYSGGHDRAPSYEAVCSGATGHAEVIQIHFDPSTISFETLVKIHLGTHNPTTLNQQGADKGTQYRSIILAHDAQQHATAERVIREVSPLFDQPIVTQIANFEVFYPAEIRHQNYYNNTPEGMYCQVVIGPKLDRLKSLFREHLNPDN